MADLSLKLFNELAIPLHDVRGLGIVMSKLSDESRTMQNCSIFARLNGSKSGDEKATEDLVTASSVNKRQNDNKQRAAKKSGDDDKRAAKKSGVVRRRLSDMEQIQGSSHRFRQTDLKRMMKLEEVKSGKHKDSGISLTQLDALPLEIKLQVVNEDYAPLGALSQRKSSAPARSRRSSTGTSSNGNNSSSIPTSKFNGAAQVEKEKQDASHNEDSSVSDSQQSLKPARAPLPEGPKDLYEEDLLPLKMFLDYSNPIDVEAVNHLKQFLIVVLQEERVGNLYTMARSIRNRKDEWSESCVLSDIMETLSKEHLERFGTPLDLS